MLSLAIWLENEAKNSGVDSFKTQAICLRGWLANAGDSGDGSSIIHVNCLTNRRLIDIEDSSLGFSKVHADCLISWLTKIKSHSTIFCLFIGVTKDCSILAILLSSPLLGLCWSFLWNVFGIS